MTEFIRSIKVTVVVDTNKRTETLEMENAGIPEIQRQVEEFITGLMS